MNGTQNPQNPSDRQVGGDHYKEMGVEPWDVVDTWPLEQRIGAYRLSALKYIMRMGSKDERLQEVEKSGHCIEKLADVLRNGGGSAELPDESELLRRRLDEALEREMALHKRCEYLESIATGFEVGRIDELAPKPPKPKKGELE